MNRTIIITVGMNSFGHLEIQPVSEKACKEIREDMAKNGCPYTEARASLYIQQDTDVESWIEDFVPRRKQEEVRQGWPVRVKLDSWAYRHMCGWSEA